MNTRALLLLTLLGCGGPLVDLDDETLADVAADLLAAEADAWRAPDGPALHAALARGLTGDALTDATRRHWVARARGARRGETAALRDWRVTDVRVVQRGPTRAQIEAVVRATVDVQHQEHAHTRRVQHRVRATLVSTPDGLRVLETATADPVVLP